LTSKSEEERGRVYSALLTGKDQRCMHDITDRWASSLCRQGPPTSQSSILDTMPKKPREPVSTLPGRLAVPRVKARGRVGIENVIGQRTPQSAGTRRLTD